MAKTKRAFERIKRRVNCDVIVAGARHVGVVLNLSPKGFFVQTGAAADIGAKVGVTLQTHEGETVEVQAVVTNRRRIPRRLVSVERGGFGCALKGPSEDYYQLLADINPPA